MSDENEVINLVFCIFTIVASFSAFYWNHQNVNANNILQQFDMDKDWCMVTALNIIKDLAVMNTKRF